MPTSGQGEGQVVVLICGSIHWQLGNSLKAFGPCVQRSGLEPLISQCTGCLGSLSILSPAEKETGSEPQTCLSLFMDLSWDVKLPNMPSG